MRPRIQAASILAASTLILLGPGCFSAYSKCGEKQARCFEGFGGFAGFGGLGTGGHTALAGGGASAGGWASGDEWGGAGQGGDAAIDPAAEPIATLGAECSSEGARACWGHASRLPLVCEFGSWNSAGQCSWDERCATEGTAQGTCQPVLPECLDREPGDWVCDGGDMRFRCGADLIDKVDREVCLGCDGGECWACAPGETAPTCSSNSVVTCSEAGKLVFTPCPADRPHCTAGACDFQPSCLGPYTPCPDAQRLCCASPYVTGGSFDQNDDPDRPATISDFRLDRSEVSNGRLRNFRDAWDDGWRPPAGSGKHTHLRDGAGLMTADGAFETGWDPEWAANVDLTDATRNDNGDTFATWENRTTDTGLPVNFVNFYEAYAFCIWDGGFLPSAAEWSYAASGGDEQRTFPWGAYLPGQPFSLAVYGCQYGGSDRICVDVSNIAAVGNFSSPGLFGQYDLAGNVAERVQGGLTIPGTCDDCLEPATTPSITDQFRGGAFDSDASALRNDATPPSVSRSTRSAQIGFRCARPP